MITPPPLSAALGSRQEAERVMLKKITQAFGLLTILSGLVGIIGNISGIILISSICKGCKTMALSAALIWIFFGTVLIYLSLRPIGRIPLILLRAVLVIISGVECLEIISSLYGTHSAVETWFVLAGSALFGSLSSPISPLAAGFIILAAAGLFFCTDPSFLVVQNSRLREVTAAAGILIVLVSFTLVMSYFFGNPFFYGTQVIPVAALSALAAFFTGAGLIAVTGPATIPLCYFMGNSTRAVLLRNFVSLSVAITLCENILFYVISSWYNLSDAVMLSAGLVIFIIVTAFVVGRMSREIGQSIDKAESALLHKNEELGELNEELMSAEEELRQNIDELTKKERDLRESEERLRISQEAASAGIWDWDIPGNHIVWSQGMFDIFGLDGKTSAASFDVWDRRLHPDDLLIAHQRVEEALANHTDLDSEYRIFRPDGELHWINARGRATYDNTGKPVRMLGICIDITPQKQTDNALRESERFLRETEKIAKLGGWKANPHTDFFQWTDGTRDIFEAPRDYRPGLAEGMKYFSKTDRPLIRSSLEKCLATGEPFTLEIQITTETGRNVWTELRGLAPIMEEATTSVTGTFQDITGRRQSDEKLKTEREKLDILADAARLLLSAEKPDLIVKTVGERVMRYLHCHTFFNYLIDEGGNRMRLNAYAGVNPEEAEKAEYLNLGESVCGAVARDGERIIVSDIFHDDDERTCLIRSFGISSYACHPLIYQGRTLGTLSFGSCEHAHFTDEELDLMQAVTDLVATAMARKKIEDALRGASQYLENLIDYANASIIVWDPAFRIQRFNRAFEFLTGMHAADVIGKPLDILFPEKTRSDSMQLIRRTSVGERWESVEIPIQHISGAIKIVLWNSANLIGADGINISSTIAQGQDITERKNAEEAAVETASLLNAALDSTADGILVVDNSSTITSYNKTFCAIWGIPEKTLDSAEEKTALGYMTPLVADSRQFLVRMKELYAHPGRESYDTVSLQDGRIFERYSKPQMIGNVIVGRVWSYRDITERKRAEEALRESMEKFRIIATNTPDHILVQDMNLRYIQVINPQLGLTERDMIGKTDYEILSREDADNLTKIKKQVLESGSAVRMEIPLANSSGEKNFFAGSYVPKRNAAGEIDGLIGYFRNVTDTKLANEKIIAALAEKEILIREIHHRVKNNLQIISGLLDMTRMRTQDSATTGVLTDMMMKIKTMAQIHTRLYESKQFDKIDMGGHIRDQVADLTNIYGRSGTEISSTVDTEDLFLSVDQAIPCALIVNEALSNVFKHAFRGRKQGTIMVSARQENKNIHINVRDDGIGMPENVDINHATSLGLKLIRSLVLQLKGSLTFESTAGGTVVNIDFPIDTEV